ncbi:caffeic acid 3-O-methyltransferase-like protein, partial [Tanacetum coccineum]
MGSIEAITNQSNEENFTYAMQLVTSTSLTMVLVNTIKLKAFEVIAEAGP